MGLVNPSISTVNGLESCTAISYEFIPAKGTPIKFTRSLPANARANAKVPIKTIGFNMLILVKSISDWITTNQRAKLISKIISVCPKIQAVVSFVKKETPFAPFIKMKKVI